MDCLMECMAFLVCLGSNVSGHSKNALDIYGPKYTSIDGHRELYRIGPMWQLSIQEAALVTGT